MLGDNTCLAPVGSAAMWECGCSLAMSAILASPIDCSTIVLEDEVAAVTITAPNVVFDLGQQTINGVTQGEDTTGVAIFDTGSYNTAITDTVIQNGVIKGFGFGVMINTENEDFMPGGTLPTTTVYNILLDSPLTTGIEVSDTDMVSRLFVDRVTFRSSAEEVIHLEASDAGFVSVKNSLFELNGLNPDDISDNAAIYAEGVQELIVEGNIFENSGQGIYVSDSAEGGSAIVANNCFRGDGTGTIADGSRGVVIDESDGTDAVTVSGNFFQDFDIALELLAASNPINVNGNCFERYTTGIFVGGDVIVNSPEDNTFDDSGIDVGYLTKRHLEQEQKDAGAGDVAQKEVAVDDASTIRYIFMHGRKRGNNKTKSPAPSSSPSFKPSSSPSSKPSSSAAPSNAPTPLVVSCECDLASELIGFFDSSSAPSSVPSGSSLPSSTPSVSASPSAAPTKKSKKKAKKKKVKNTKAKKNKAKKSKRTV
jgi:parallel beta-helix repeat protein